MRAALLVTAFLVLAAPAHAGQIVFSRDSGADQMQLWTMNDRGRGARLLVGNEPLGLSTLREAAVSRDGRTIAFSGHTNRNAGTFGGQFHYGVNATGLYLWRSGQIRRVTGDPAPCNGCSTFETKPSLTPEGDTVTAETFFSNAQSGNFGRLLVRPGGGGDANVFATACDDTSLDDPAAAPRGNRIAYVGCGDDVLVAGPGRADERAAHTVRRRGQFAPETSSPAWSPDGSRLVAVDRPGDETTEIWTFAADGSDQRLVLTAPAGIAIRTVTWMGAGRLLFDVNFDNGTDLWTVPTGCSACAFPAGVTRLTNNGTSRDPAWTPAARIGGSPLTSVRAVRARRGIALRLRLTEAARVRITVGRAGTVTRRLRAGTRTVRITRVRGRALRPGRYRVVIRVTGAPARRLTVRAR
jgi:Tol biopolymer transport system component